MEINAYLLFGIDFRPYLEKDDSVRAEASKEVITERQKRIDIKIAAGKRYGNIVYPKAIRHLIDESVIARCKQRLTNASSCVSEAQKASNLVEYYLTKTLGPLVIRKVLRTSQIVRCCNEIGITMDIFDYFVSYREIRDADAAIYPFADT